MQDEIDVDAVTALQDRLVAQWHVVVPACEGEGFPIPDAFLALAAEQHLRNFRLWHVEDEARRTDADDTYIAAQKRAIDGINQQRQDLIEKLDEALIALWPWVMENAQLPLNSETPGSVIDRLSIGSLKMFHMKEQAQRADADDAHRERCRGRVAVLQRQRADLSRALSELLVDLRDRRKRLQVYRQFKMYNDPTLNPAVYARSGAGRPGS